MSSPPTLMSMFQEQYQQSVQPWKQQWLSWQLPAALPAALRNELVSQLISQLERNARGNKRRIDDLHSRTKQTRLRKVEGNMFMFQSKTQRILQLDHRTWGARLFRQIFRIPFIAFCVL